MECINDKCITVVHNIISTIRPNRFLSNLLTEHWVIMYTKFGSERFIEIVFKLGISSSYYNIIILESLLLDSPKLSIKQNSFCRYVFDNNDFNTSTTVGFNMCHKLGGIMIITPDTDIILHSEGI